MSKNKNNKNPASATAAAGTSAANKKERKNRINWKEVGSVALGIATNPGFWKGITAIIKAANHPSWYGGESNSFSGSIGPFMPANIVSKTGPAIFYSRVGYKIDPAKMIDTDLIDATFEAMITTYDKGLGFASGLTRAHITDYIKAAIRYLAAFATVKRISSALNVPFVLGFKYDRILSDDKVVHFDKWETGKISGDTNQWPDQTVAGKFILPSISNAVWLRDYGQEVLDLVLLDHHFEFVSYLFDGVFTNDITSGVNATVEFTPFTHYQVGTLKTDLKEHLDRFKATLLAAKAANPYILGFLASLGWGHPVPTDYLNRDMTGMSLLTLSDDAHKASMAAASYYQTLGLYPGDNLEDLIANRGKAPIFLDFSGDLDPNFSRYTDSFSIGTLGSILKLAIMRADPSYAYVLGKATGSGGITDKTSHLTVKIGYKIDVSPGTDAMRAKAYLYNNRMIDFPTLAGVENMLTAPVMGSVASGSGVYELDYHPTRPYTLLGSDAVMFNDYATIIDLIKANFTFGVNYMENFIKFADSVQNILRIK
jgi:hypothetical protein